MFKKLSVYRHNDDLSHLPYLIQYQIGHEYTTFVSPEDVDMWSIAGMFKADTETERGAFMHAIDFSKTCLKEMVLFDNIDPRFFYGSLDDFTFSDGDITKMVAADKLSFGEEYGFYLSLLKVLRVDIERGTEFFETYVPDDFSVFNTINYWLTLCRDFEMSIEDFFTHSDGQWIISSVVELSAHIKKPLSDQDKTIVLHTIDSLGSIDQHHSTFLKGGMCSDDVHKNISTTMQLISTDINTYKMLFLRVRNFISLLVRFDGDGSKIDFDLYERYCRNKLLSSKEYGHLVPYLMTLCGRMCTNTELTYQLLYPAAFAGFGTSKYDASNPPLSNDMVEERIFYLQDIMSKVETGDHEHVRVNMCIDNIFFNGQKQAYNYLKNNGAMKYDEDTISTDIR